MVSREAAVDSDALSKARCAPGPSGVRRSRPTPGAFGPSAVGMSSTYWATDDAPGLGGFASARAAPAKVDATTATKIVAMPARGERAHTAFRERARGTRE
jgi:hypothetical protein